MKRHQDGHRILATNIFADHDDCCRYAAVRPFGHALMPVLTRDSFLNTKKAIQGHIRNNYTGCLGSFYLTVNMIHDPFFTPVVAYSLRVGRVLVGRHIKKNNGEKAQGWPSNPRNQYPVLATKYVLAISRPAYTVLGGSTVTMGVYNHCVVVQFYK